MIFPEFSIPHASHSIKYDWCGEKNRTPLVLLHGAGKGTKDRYASFRSRLLQKNIQSIALDFIGHGTTGGELSSSSLKSRTEQAQGMLGAENIRKPGCILGASMGAYNALKLSEMYALKSLVLVVPGIYVPEAYIIPFGPKFSEVIRKPNSWMESDAWEIITKFRGNLLIIGAENDNVIPRKIPERLFESAKNASARALYWVKDGPHLLVQFLNSNPQEFDTVIEKVAATFRS